MCEKMKTCIAKSWLASTIISYVYLYTLGKVCVCVPVALHLYTILIRALGLRLSID